MPPVSFPHYDIVSSIAIQIGHRDRSASCCIPDGGIQLPVLILEENENGVVIRRVEVAGGCQHDIIATIVVEVTNRNRLWPGPNLIGTVSPKDRSRSWCFWSAQCRLNGWFGWLDSHEAAVVSTLRHVPRFSVLLIMNRHPVCGRLTDAPDG